MSSHNSARKSLLRTCITFFLIGFLLNACNGKKSSEAQKFAFIPADNENIQYTGRIDFTDPKKPRFWAPGVYISAKFKGSYCEIVINDEVLGGENYNYLEVIVDGGLPSRIQTTEKLNSIVVAEGLSSGEHTITICKNTESSIGYLEFLGFKCEGLVPLPPKLSRKIEFIGNSITCGMGSDLSVVACDSGQWYDQHNAYMSYGPITARQLGAQWQLTAVSGIGLMHSCCDMDITMPEVFDKINLSGDTIQWDFDRYHPDVVTICLGQNDGIQDSVDFSTAYVDFIEDIRGHYPEAHIVCLTSPMADENLMPVLKNYLTGVVEYINNTGDDNVGKFFFSRSYNKGCGGHPDLNQHQLIAGELIGYFKKELAW